MRSQSLNIVYLNPVHCVEPWLQKIGKLAGFLLGSPSAVWSHHLAPVGHKFCFLLLCTGITGLLVVTHTYKHNIHIVSFYSCSYSMKWVEAAHPHFTSEKNGDPKWLFDKVAGSFVALRGELRSPDSHSCVHRLFFLMKVQMCQDGHCLFKRRWLKNNKLIIKYSEVLTSVKKSKH